MWGAGGDEAYHSSGAGVPRAGVVGGGPAQGAMMFQRNGSVDSLSSAEPTDDSWLRPGEAGVGAVVGHPPGHALEAEQVLQ